MSYESRTPIKVVATNEGMRKGYWKIVAVDIDGREVELLETMQSKRLAIHVAAQANAQGFYMTGISGARYPQALGVPAHERFYRDAPRSELIKP